MRSKLNGSAALMMSLALVVTACASDPGANGGEDKTDSSAAGESPEDDSGDPDVVNLQLNWHPEAAHAGFYVADEQGYYGEEGLAVNIISGSGSGDAIRRVDAGQAHVGVADSGVLIGANRGGADLRIVKMIADESLMAIFATKDSGIEEISDLEGAIIGAPPEDSGRLLMPVVAAAAGIDHDKIEYLDIDPANKYPAFAAGRVDAVFDTRQNRVLLAEAAEGDENVTMMPFADHGVDLYAHAVFTTLEFLEESPDVLERFLHATQRGWRFTIENPEEAASMVLGRNPQMNADHFGAQLSEQLDLMCTDNYRENGVGFVDAEKMQSSIDIVQEFLGSDNEMEEIESVDQVMTNEFLSDVALPDC